jgi:hypothetical protein
MGSLSSTRRAPLEDESTSNEHQPATKRRRLHDFPAVNIDSLPDAVLQVCFSFIGPGYYRYVAGVCRRFEDIYSIKHEKKTMWKAAAANVACAELCWSDIGREPAAVAIFIACAAIKAGNLKVLECARVRGSNFIPGMFLPAVETGNVSILKWAADHNLNWFAPVLTAQAAGHGNVNVLEFIWRQNREFHTTTAGNAAVRGHVSVLSWMKERNMLGDQDESTLESLWSDAIRHEQIIVLDWLRSEGYDVYPLLVILAVRGEYFKVLSWAKAHNIRWNVFACGQAAFIGNLTVLQWLRENGCPWDGATIRVARRYGHDHVAEWAIENGCPQE